MIIRPQPGAQEAFLSSPADLCIYGGAAGGGKSYALLLEPVRHIRVPGFTAGIFRESYAQIKKPGALWDQSCEIYPYLGGVAQIGNLTWTFPTTGRPAVISFNQLESEQDKYKYQGSQFAFLGFDELTHFTASQFWYMFSRNRSVCGVRPYVRATCNPDPDSFVKELIEWYLDDACEYPNLHRSGDLRSFFRLNDKAFFFAGVEAAYAACEDPNMVKTFSFIPASVYDNKMLLENDPGYISNLLALNKVDRERLLRGNWKIRPAAGMYFRREYFAFCDKDTLPADRVRVRYWDRAATEPSSENPNPDWTAGVLLSKSGARYFVEDVQRFRGSPATVRGRIRATAELDGHEVRVLLEQEPGASGKSEVGDLIRFLDGFAAKACRPTGDKMTRAAPFSAQAEARNVTLVRGAWNADYISELENFGSGVGHDDQVDGTSGGHEALSTRRLSVF